MESVGQESSLRGAKRRSNLDLRTRLPRPFGARNDKVVPNEVLDCYGLLCPVPIRKTATAIEGLRVGEILQVIATDDWFVPDLEAWLRSHPHELLGVQTQGSETHVFLRKTFPSPQPSPSRGEGEPLQ